MNDTFFSQSIKELYRHDIIESLELQTLYKIYEFIDDYTYTDSENVGIYYNDKNELILCMDKSSNDKLELRKLLEWRRSGNSNEIGHKGGGNKKNIFGHKSEETTIISRIDETNCIIGSVKPNSILKLSESNIDESNFRTKVDTSEYINIPESRDIEEMPIWYKKLYNKIYKLFNFYPKFIIKMKLTEDILDYKDKDKWNILISCIEAKQYNIKIHYNNFYHNKTSKICNNINLIGTEYIDENYKNIKLEILFDNNNNIYIRHNEQIINCKTKNNIENNNNLILFGYIHMFIVDSKTFKINLAKFINKNPELKSEYCDSSFCGIYIKLNNKYVNFKPINSNLLGDSKNNKIINNIKSSCYFRMVLEPVCKDNNILNKLIITNSIKALTNFLDDSQYKILIDISKKIYKGINILDEKQNPRLKQKNIDTNNKSIFYLIYFGYGLYKFGQTNDYNKRKNKHLKECSKNIEEFRGIKVIDNNLIEIFKFSTSSPSACEEKILTYLDDKIVSDCNIILYENKGNRNKCREYFYCNNIDYLLYNVKPNLIKEFK